MLEELCPKSFACDWDNVGLLVGSSGKEVHTIALALDATSEVIKEAVEKGADLILTHHPLIFGGVRNITDSDYVGKRILELVKHDISCYAMHTNFDVLGMADAAADLLNLTDREVLEVTYEDEISVDGLGRVGSLLEPMLRRSGPAARHMRDPARLGKRRDRPGRQGERGRLRHRRHIASRRHRRRGEGNCSCRRRPLRHRKDLYPLYEGIS